MSTADRVLGCVKRKVARVVNAKAQLSGCMAAETNVRSRTWSLMVFGNVQDMLAQELR